MSGGVDSSMAAALLREQGHDVIGLSMQLYPQNVQDFGPRGEDDAHRISFGSCCTLDDLNDARRVAFAIGIPHYIVNLERRFDEQVVSNFVSEYTRGRTPLPCAHCNTDLKFDALLQRATALRADAVATGHYARVESRGGRYVLLRGIDDSKDQAYFLFGLTQEQLSHALFPLGLLRKADVREMARVRGLLVADKRDSQEICFVPGGDYAAFVAKHAPESRRAGVIVDVEGRAVGRHDGIHHFTVGQRKGLRLSATVPLYVTAIRADTNTVVVGPREHLERRTLAASGVNWIGGEVPAFPLRAAVQIRSRHAAAPATVTAQPDGRATVVFDEPQSAVTPGQAAVFYSGDEVLGGGWID